MTASAVQILQTSPIHPFLDARVDDLGDVIRLWDPASAARLETEAGDVRLVVTSGPRGLERALMDRLTGLRAITGFGVGYDKIDVPAAKARGIQISYTPGVLEDCVADHAFGLVIDTMRRISASDRFVRAGKWLAGPFGTATRVSGKKLGILGLGNIGRVLARRASGFDMPVGYHNRRPVADVPHRYFPTLVELAAWADALVVLCPGGEATRGLVNAEVLEALGPDGVLVNVARGSIVDDAALLAALDAHRIAAAGLDVFVDEPRVPEGHLGRDDVVLTPHVASATKETRQAMAEAVIANIEAFLETGRVKTPIPA